MYSTSDKYKEVIQKDIIWDVEKLVIDVEEYTDFIKLHRKAGIVSDDHVNFGNCISSFLDVEIPEISNATKFIGRKVYYYVGLHLENYDNDEAENIEWIPMGVFNIVEPDVNDQVLSFTAYDNMYYTQQGFFSDLKGSQKVSTVLNEQCKKIGITYAGGDSGESINVDLLQGLELRDALGYIASYCGKNAIMNRQGNLQLKWFEEVDVTIPPDRCSDTFNVAPKDTTIGRLVCAVSKEQTFTHGSEVASAISFSNPLMTETQSKVLFDKVNGFTYRAINFNAIIGRPEIDVGDIIKVQDLDGTIYHVPVFIMENDGFNQTIQANAKTEEQEKFEFQGSVSKAIENTYSEIVSAKKVMADTVIAFDGKFQTLDTDILNVNKKIKAYEGQFEIIDSDIAKLKQADIDNLTAVNGRIDSLVTTDLTSVNAKINNLEVDIENVNTLLAGSVTSGSTQTIVLNAQNTTIANALIKSAMIESLSFDKITGIDVNTTKLTVHSNDGKSTWKDNTIQISDANRVRVQVGKDASGDYNMYVWDKSGNLMFDATGITAKGIQRPIIVNDMVSDNANISGDKINITSVIQKINENSTLIESHHILYDGKSLDVAFGTMETSISTVTSNVNTVTKTVTDNKTKWDTASTNATNALNTANTVTKTVSDNKANWDKAPTALTNANNAQNTANNAQSVANSKAKVFNAQPVPPYQVGDLWVQGTSGVIMRCKTARASGSYTASDWEKADKYTDDTKANAVDTKVTTVTETVKSHSTQLTAQDGKISTLISDNTQVKKDITAVQGDITIAKGNITTLQTNYSTLDQSVKGLSSTVGEHTSKLTTVTNTVNNNKANWDKAPTALDNANKAQSTANTANTNANNALKGIQNLRSSGLGIKVNYSTFTQANDAEIYFHGFDTYGNPTDTDGWVMYNGAKVTIPKGMWVNPNSAIPFNTLCYLVLDQSHKGIVSCWYDTSAKIWKYQYCDGAPANTGQSGTENFNDQNIVLGYYVNSGSAEAKFTSAGLFDPVKSYRDIVISPEATTSINTVNTRITTEIKTVSDKYASLQQDVNGFKTTVSSTYSTKTEVSKVKSDAATDATNKANQAKTDAINSANANTTSLLKSYSKTEAMNSAITQKADEITAAVSKTYATQATVNTINGDVSALKTWKTSAETKITDTAIVNTVRNSTNYKNDLTGKVGKTEIISCINQTAETIKIDASKIELTGKVTISMLDSDTQTKVNNGNNAMSSINTNKANWDKGKTAYDWTNTNGGNMTNLRNMVLKWTNNAVSTSTYIQGGWIATNTITTAQIATGTIVIGDLDSGVQTKLNTGYDNAYKAYWMSMALSQGQSMYNDPAFLRGINGLDIYNNSNNTAVTITREAKASGWTYDTPYRIKVTSNGTTSPNHGGIRWGFTPKAGHTYLFKLIAKIPTGRTISWHTNDIGTGSKQEWLTPTAGTNDWTEYVCKVKIGTGTISTTGFFSINGGATGFSWYIVYANVFDLGSENLISTFTKGTTEIYGDYIKTGTITANHIRGNKLEGTEIVGGKISSNTTIDVTTDLKVGNNIYLNTPSSGNKYIYFNGTSQFISYNANAINVTSSSSYIRSTGGAYCSARSDGVVISNAKSSMIWMKADNTICVDGPIYTRNGIKFDSSSSTGIYTSWVDLKNHDLLVRSEDMCSCYYGCASISYDQWTYVRGKYVKLYNHSGGYCQVNGAAITSDINLKYDFRTFDERYNDFFMNLRPTIYKYQTGTAKRDHFGYVAQEVESALYKSGLSTNDFAGVIIDKNITRTEDDTDSNLLLDKGINEMHLLRYEEFIALNTHMIQKTIKAVDTQGAMLKSHERVISEVDRKSKENEYKIEQLKKQLDEERQLRIKAEQKLNAIISGEIKLESRMA